MLAGRQHTNMDLLRYEGAQMVISSPPLYFHSKIATDLIDLGLSQASSSITLHRSGSSEVTTAQVSFGLVQWHCAALLCGIL